MTVVAPSPPTEASTRLALRVRLVRCMGVSVVSTTVCFTILVVLTAGFSIGAALANIVATGTATVPSYHLNRRWTWGRRERSDPWREVLPFWILSFCGLAISTVTVFLADGWATSLHLVPAVHTAVILGSQLSGFGLLWILQFVLLDRVLFGRRPTAQPAPGFHRGVARG